MGANVSTYVEGSMSMEPHIDFDPTIIFTYRYECIK